ncbi:MAG: hypothetical protein ACK5Z0_07695 [Planctomycetota bacterium]
MMEGQLALPGDCNLLKLTAAQQIGHQPQSTRLNPREFRGLV